jgi:hypothetical protein
MIEKLIPEKYRADKALRTKRLLICMKCEDLNALNQCKHCLCFVHLKTMLKNEECEKPKSADKKW